MSTNLTVYQRSKTVNWAKIYWAGFGCSFAYWTIRDISRTDYHDEDHPFAVFCIGLCASAIVSSMWPGYILFPIRDATVGKPSTWKNR